MNTIKTYKSKQELVNAICREYADFIGFDLDKIECNERYFYTVYRYACKVDALIEEINNVNNGKYYIICNELSTCLMPHPLVHNPHPLANQHLSGKPSNIIC